MYRVEGTDNVFRMFWKHGIATVAELRNGWSWTDTPTYYTWVERDDTIFTNPIPLLKLVWWYNPTLRIKYVEPGSYSLFIRHGLEEYYKFAGRTNLKIALFAKREGEDTPIVENKIFYDDKFLTSEEAKKNRKLDKFGNTFIFYFNTDDTYKLCNNELSLGNIRNSFLHFNS